MADQIHSRENLSSEIRKKARELLNERIDKWGNSASIGSKVCVYTTGSFGRNDASNHSDLDVFIVSLEEEVGSDRLLSRLEEIELLASIVDVNRQLKLPELDNDGGFLKVHKLSDYLVGLGKPSDDANNTFTGRLLLLLESQPIFGEVKYDEILKECINRYWRDHADHADSFLPAFLINDILRFWRTLCVSYEVGMRDTPAKRRAKNYKLKFSRLLTCFSAIVALHVHFAKNGTVSEQDALSLIKLTPLDRLRVSRENVSTDLQHYFDSLIDMYRTFLQHTDCSKSELYAKMEEPSYYTKSLEDARNFGDTMYRLLRDLSEKGGDRGENWRFFRYVAI
jgi:predicted nucleotidyltransferase